MENLEKLFSNDDISLEQIIYELMSPENIELKTDIKNPNSLAVLKLISYRLKEKNKIKSYKLLKNYIKFYLTFMVSENRKSRDELIQALKGFVEKYTASDKIFGNLEGVK